MKLNDYFYKIKFFWILEILYLVASIIFMLKAGMLQNSNDFFGNSKYSFVTMNFAGYYGLVGFGINFFGLLLSMYLFLEFKTIYILTHNLHTFYVLISSINLLIIVFILFALSSPLLWAFFLIVGIGGILLIGMTT